MKTHTVSIKPIGHKCLEQRLCVPEIQSRPNNYEQHFFNDYTHFNAVRLNPKSTAAVVWIYSTRHGPDSYCGSHAPLVITRSKTELFNMCISSMISDRAIDSFTIRVDKSRVVAQLVTAHQYSMASSLTSLLCVRSSCIRIVYQYGRTDQLLDVGRPGPALPRCADRSSRPALSDGEGTSQS